MSWLLALLLMPTPGRRYSKRNAHDFARQRLRDLVDDQYRVTTDGLPIVNEKIGNAIAYVDAEHVAGPKFNAALEAFIAALAGQIILGHEPDYTRLVRSGRKPINSGDVFMLMRGICPLWPFCWKGPRHVEPMS